MRHIFAALFALVSACVACAPTAKAPNYPVYDPISALKSKTVALVETEQVGDLLQSVEYHVYCSGVWVDSNTIVTANHCVSELGIGADVYYATQADVSPLDNDAISTTHEAILLAVDEAHDLALVRVSDAPSHEWASLAQNAYVGERDVSMGHPLGLLWSYSEGQIAAIRRTGDLGLDLVWIQSTAPISPGNSGGGLFNEQGQLLGICSRGYFGKAENLNFYVHVDYVRALIRATK